MGKQSFSSQPFQRHCLDHISLYCFPSPEKLFWDRALLMKYLKQEFESLPQVLRIDQWPEGLRLDITNKMRNTIHVNYENTKLKKKKRKKEDNPQICSVEPYWRNSTQAVPTLLGRLAEGP